jgi:hypothetical protein
MPSLVIGSFGSLIFISPSVKSAGLTAGGGPAIGESPCCFTVRWDRQMLRPIRPGAFGSDGVLDPTSDGTKIDVEAAVKLRFAGDDTGS